MTIDDIYENLMNGGVYGYQVNYVRYPYFCYVLNLGTCGWTGRKLFYWHHAGSSANRATKKELKWILGNIFEMTPDEFCEKYECRRAE